MRIDKVLANLNFGSRKEVHALLKQGHVVVNGVVVTKKDAHVNPEVDMIVVAGATVDTRLTRYIAFHKPAGCVTAVEDSRQETVMEWLPEEFHKLGVVPVGRLDKDTEGLLLLTNDGQWAHRMIHGKKEVPKRYRFLYEGMLSPDAEARIAEGLCIDDTWTCKPGLLRRLHEKEAELIISEGKFHQVKRMVAACGATVTYLQRLSVGPITLEGIEKPGMFRDLTVEELEACNE